MQNTALRIETILAKDLYTFYCNYAEHAGGQQISPISKYRALSQSKNPCAEEGDVGLLVAYIGESLTRQMVREVWPKLSLNDLDFGKGDKK